MFTTRSFTLGLSVGLFAATLAIAGELLGWFNCINAWLVETVVLTSYFAVAMRRFRAIAVGSSVLVAYITIISYVVIHSHINGRWFSDDWIPVIASFLLLVALPTSFAGALDLASARHARNDA